MKGKKHGRDVTIRVRQTWQKSISEFRKQVSVPAEGKGARWEWQCVCPDSTEQRGLVIDLNYLTLYSTSPR